MILSKFCPDFEPRLVGFTVESDYALASTFCFVSFVEWTSKERLMAGSHWGEAGRKRILGKCGVLAPGCSLACKSLL